ncbi:MAG: hypothetical protein P8O13_09250 [Porticoccaceae bacterium]|nr:hypothetical protein [Porticoccaceae bacterium]
MSDTEKEQLFNLAGVSAELGDVLDGPVGESTETSRASFNTNADAVVVNSPSQRVVDKQEVLIANEYDDASMSADKALFDDLLSQRISKVKRVSADISSHLDALDGHHEVPPVTSSESL